MDNHPIPQDITGFQFKLVGNMTIKQFVYLAIGAIFAWLFFFIIEPPTLIKWPLAIGSFALGAMIAFVPVDGRPMDIMLINFIKALVSPTEYRYVKEGGKLSKTPLSPPAPISTPTTSITRQIQTPVPADIPTPKKETSSGEDVDNNKVPHHSLIQDFKETLEHKKTAKEVSKIKEMKEENTKLHEEIEEIKKTSTPPEPMQDSISPPPPVQPVSGFGSEFISPVPLSEESSDSKEIEKKDRELEEVRKDKDKLKEELELLKKQLDETIKEKDKLASAPVEVTPPPPIPQISPSQNELEKKLIESNREKDAFEKELISLKSKSQEETKKTFTPIVARPAESTQSVRSIPQGMEKSAGIPSIPDAPNLITGIVKDPRGNPLQNILIEVKDEDSNPVRAFKTNGLGKFASATSLSNGKYVISFEDTKETHKFDAVEMELVGSPVMPLEIISVDPREELRRELFN